MSPRSRKEITKLSQSKLKNIFNESTIIDLSNRLHLESYLFEGAEAPEDRVATLVNLLRTEIGGRPKPFSMMEAYGATIEHIKDSEEKREYERSIRYFAEVGELSSEHPNDAALVVGSVEFGKKDLIRFRDWLNSVIEWHEQNLETVPQ